MVLSVYKNQRFYLKRKTTRLGGEVGGKEKAVHITRQKERNEIKNAVVAPVFAGEIFDDYNSPNKDQYCEYGLAIWEQ